MMVDSLSAVARGADGVCFFQFRQSSFGAERFHSAVVPLAGEDTRVFHEASALGARLQELRLLTGEATPSRIAVLFDWDSWWAAESPDGPSDRLGVLDQLQAYYRPLLRRGLSVEVVHPGAPLDRFDLVLVPSLFLLREHHADALADWVHLGGTAVVGPFTGVADDRGHLREGRFPSVLAALVGVTGEEWRPLAVPVALDIVDPDHTGGARPGAPSPAPFEASVWSEDLRLHSPTASTIATFATGSLAGKPAAVRNSHGAGAAWYVGCDAPAALLSHIVGTAVAEAGLASPVVGELPDDVELATRAGYHFLLNHGPETRVVHLTEHSVDLLSGEPHGTRLALRPYDALVLKSGADHTKNESGTP